MTRWITTSSHSFRPPWCRCSGRVCGYLAGKLRAAAKRAKEKDAADQKQQAALVDGVKSLLRGQIIDDGLHYLAEGAIPPFALQSMELQYDAYERLGDGDKSRQ